MTIKGDIDLEATYYIYVYNSNLFNTNPDELIEGKHYATIPVKIDSYQFERDKEGKLNCMVTLEEQVELPEWYDYEDHYDDFNVPVNFLYDNTFWLPLEWGYFEE